MTTVTVHPGRLKGSFVVPGDKSLSHRALMVGSIASGESRIRGLSTGADVISTRNCLTALGVTISDDGHVTPPTTFSMPDMPLDCGNSGTTMRLMLGLLAGRSGEWTLSGDESLRNRPMARVTERIAEIGGKFRLEGGLPPVTVVGSELHPGAVHTGVPSAQVKSAVMLAALTASGPVRITEPEPTRDHTERMLLSAGIEIEQTEHDITVSPGQPKALDIMIGGDPSSAAYLVVAGLIRGDVHIRNVNANPGRVAYLEHLGPVTVTPASDEAGEPTVTLKSGQAILKPIQVGPHNTAAVIDEIPVLAVAAAYAKGTSTFTGVGELRVKESDRIDSICAGLAAIGVECDSNRDSFTVHGTGKVAGGEVDSKGDHRIALAFATAALGADSPITIHGADAADVSWPGFFELLRGAGVEVSS